MFDFSNRTVLITGATGNLGSAVARAFSAAGANLVLVDRTSDRLASLFPDLAGSQKHLLANSVDISDPEAIQRTVAESLDRFGHLDVLVNTVGGFRPGAPLHETSLETWDFLLNLNARTIFVACQAVVPALLAQGSGKIVNVAARAAMSGSANLSAYTAAKSAVVRITESLAEELKPQGINVNCILPGRMDTPQNRRETPDANFSRWVAPEAIADVILFLASDAARAIYGATIPVYGQS